MAFLLALLPEAALAIGEVGAFTAEATGSSFAGAAVATGITGYAGKKLDEAAGSVVSSGVDAVFGAGTSEKVSSGASKFAKEAPNLAVNIAFRETGTSVNASNATGAKGMFDQYFGYKERGPDLFAEAKKQGYTWDKPKPSPKEIAKSPQPVLEKPTTPSAAFVPNTDLRSSGQSPNGDVVDSRKRGEDLGRFISMTGTVLTSDGETPISKAYGIVAGSNPLLSYLIPSLSKFQAGMTVPTNENYLKISQVYNGKNLTHLNVLETVNEDGTKSFSALDETGATITWNTAWNNHKTVPPIWGTWTGINSPNNTKPVSLLDLFAFFHDYSYHVYGNFNETGDYQLISRVYSNLDRMSGSERDIALMTVKYFSTIGMAARLYAGNKGETIYLGNVSASDSVKTDDSVFPHVVPEAATLSPEGYLECKKYFFEGLEHGLIDESLNSSVASTYAKPVQNPMILSAIDNLMVQLA